MASSDAPLSNSTDSAIPSRIDRDLWDRVVEGDAAAFESIVQRYQSAVSAVAYGIVGDLVACQDVAQETFWSAWRGRRELREPHRLAAWLCGIARNLAHQWNRKYGSRRRDTAAIEQAAWLAAGDDPAEQTIAAEQQALVWSSLETLPPSCREALILYYRQGRSVAEVAETLEISQDAARQRLSRGRAALRDQLAAVVEDVLDRSRPGRAFTAKVMAGVVATSASLKAGTATAAGPAAKIATGVSGGLASSAAGAGLAGGLLGAFGGLGGAWLGTWLPAQLAPTQAERDLLERSGRQTMRWAVVFTVLVLLMMPLIFLPNGWLYFLVGLFSSQIVFVAMVVRNGIRTQRMVQQIRHQIAPEDDPNPSALRTRFAPSDREPTAACRGRSYRSRLTLLGLPLVDVAFADPILPAGGRPPAVPARTARGWIAIGDRAQGILLAIGGRAVGLIALGGLAIGGVAAGGLSLGVLSFGGLAIGGLAIGGGAIGWDAVGGGAIALHAAAGGFAMAWHAAVGGGAIAHDLAVGGEAIAREANTAHASEFVESLLPYRLLRWYIAHRVAVTGAILLTALAPLLFLPWVYGRACRSRQD